ncbi:uncharacterized protein K452DRAFT_303606 [Aplosporella prunicola CBS 121167]|uniref:Peroxidase n=1 Tax=Aplosporella prunicola CBS 121167 TaxID=1176127 RepID=A0A6A6AVY9_9PEZI|nr:uncharacterized protein K452DRAFT_303606 [Aplosporella prunicola CBS 121167]KAF2135353.1 hypothetical protein K452DRAFT_303606 [Aplosporella prunicola CBS 121167]
MKTSSLASIALLQFLRANADYTWPSKHDFLEDLISIQSGYIHEGFGDAVNPCGSSPDGHGRQSAAEWIRSAYHDMSTHDVNTGHGGMDGSIVLETARDENVGDAFNSTFGFMEIWHTSRSSMADLLAIGVKVASASCQGPEVAFRAGRIDATDLGVTGVPKPDQDLKTHTTKFANQGFNVSDMIAMVACGHAFGGVHGKDFPEITGDDSEDNFPHFTSTSVGGFDNRVVTDYLNGSSTNPLVVGKNETNNSDKRIFGADGNVTMQALADPATFMERCSDIFTRMIDTVPAAVTLSDVIDSLDVKPYGLQLSLNSDAKTLHFSGKIRIKTTKRDANDMSVSLAYRDRNGKSCNNCKIATTIAVLRGGQSYNWKDTFNWFEFDTTLDADTSISGFDVLITEAGKTETRDNNGHGYPVQDSILYQFDQSCLPQEADADGNWPLQVVAAIRKDSVSVPAVLEFAAKVPRQGSITPRLEVQSSKFEKIEGGEKGQYVLFKATQPVLPASWSSNMDLVLGKGDAEKMVEFQRTNEIGQECKAF